MNSRAGILLVQNNFDPWKGGIEEYQNEVSSLIALTEEGFKAHPQTEIVVWPETAVVVDFVKHYESLPQNPRKKLADKVLNYFDSKECLFVTGSNHLDYNSVLIFEGKKNCIPPLPDFYHKNHLVPFSESFPEISVLRPVYDRMEKNGNKFWKSGTELKVFDYNGIRFSTPVCFEDTFPEIPKKMHDNGAQLIINLSNDSWSHSLACQNQHLSMAVFRSAENGIPSVRSTVSGQTCYIDEKGRIIQQLEPFVPGVLYCEVNLNRIK